jgi:hypothetical protein
MPDVRRLAACGGFRGLRNEKYFTKDESRRPCQQARSGFSPDHRRGNFRNLLRSATPS